MFVRSERFSNFNGLSEAIALAVEVQADYVLGDDVAARKETIRLGLDVKGTPDSDCYRCSNSRCRCGNTYFQRIYPEFADKIIAPGLPESG